MSHGSLEELLRRTWSANVPPDGNMLTRIGIFQGELVVSGYSTRRRTARQAVSAENSIVRVSMAGARFNQEAFTIHNCRRS